MVLRLLVKVANGSSEPAEHLFEEEQVLIGRGEENHLALPDQSRVVSSRHAEVRRKGTALQLIDLGSKNFTYLKGDRLEPERPYAIQDGDAFRIGPFEIEVRLSEEAAPQEATPSRREQTLFDANFVNPFEKDAMTLAATLRGLRGTYDMVATSRQADALRDALRDVLPSERHAADALVARLIGGTSDESAPSALPEQALPPPEPDVREAPAAWPAPPAWSDTPSHSVGPAVQAVAPRRRERLLGVLLEAAVRLIGVPWQFRHEFIGQTILQSSETAFLYEGDAQALGRHLLDSELSDERFEHRLSLLREAIGSLGVHHVAMVEGYKAAAREGAQQLAVGLRPEAAREEVRQERAWYAALPFLMSRAVVARLRQKAEELASEDWSVAERRVYRPAFICAYLARMTSVRGNRPPDWAAALGASEDYPTNDPSQNKMT